MDYESMYKLFDINSTDMQQLNKMIENVTTDYAIRRNIILTTLIHDNFGTQVINKEVSYAELV